MERNDVYTEQLPSPDYAAIMKGLADEGVLVRHCTLYNKDLDTHTEPKHRIGLLYIYTYIYMYMYIYIYIYVCMYVSVISCPGVLQQKYSAD